MKIKRDNYEAFLLDQLEGRLSAEDQQELRDFLLSNPDCAVEMGGGGSWILEKSPVRFPAKSQLRKELPGEASRLTPANFDLFSIARMEGDLTVEQEKDHAAMVAEDEAMEQEWQQWQRTRLVAEPVVFAGKERLKRRKGRTGRVIWMGVVAAAATVTLVLILLKNGPAGPEPPMALEVESQVPGAEEPVYVAATGDPPPGEASPVTPAEPKQEVNGHAGLFSIRRDHGEPEPSRVNNDTTSRVLQEQVQPKPLRVAVLSPAVAARVDPGSYDRIKPLALPASSIHLSSLSIAQIAEMDIQELVEGYAEENDISLWSIANAGIRGINRITGADMALLAARDEEGDLSGFRLRARRFSVTSPLDRSE